MSPLKKKPEINLLPVDKFAASVLGRTLTWLLSTFRIIVIIVEMVVMTAFLSRFWLDAKNSDLTDEIIQKQNLLAAFSSFENDFNSAKEKITIYSSLSTPENQLSPALGKIPSLLPEGVTLKSLSLSSTGIGLDGSAQTEQQIAQLLANLEADKSYQNPLLTKIGIDEESRLYLFKIETY